MKPEKLTITAGAVAFGTTRETLKRALARAGLTTGEGMTFTILQLHNVLAGDTRAERARLLSERADKIALENKTRRGELVSISKMELLLWQRIYLPMKAELEAMPEKLAPKIAPDDSPRVQTILRDWVEEMKASCLEPKSNENEKIE